MHLYTLLGVLEPVCLAFLLSWPQCAHVTFGCILVSAQNSNYHTEPICLLTFIEHWSWSSLLVCRKPSLSFCLHSILPVHLLPWCSSELLYISVHAKHECRGTGDNDAESSPLIGKAAGWRQLSSVNKCHVHTYSSRNSRFFFNVPVFLPRVRWMLVAGIRKYAMLRGYCREQIYTGLYTYIYWPIHLHILAYTLTHTGLYTYIYWPIHLHIYGPGNERCLGHSKAVRCPSIVVKSIF